MLDLKELRAQSLLAEAAMEGDRLGAPFEGKREFSNPDYGLLKLAAKNKTGTDESDLLRCWAGYHKLVGDSVDPVGWAEYYADHYGVARYGKTMPDLFNLVRWQRKVGADNRYAQLVVISTDRNSFGNLCLQMVAPLVSVALRTGENPYDLVTRFVVMTHAHSIAVNACRDLCRLFVDGPQALVPRYPKNSLTGHWDAGHTLHAAWWCAQFETKEKVIEEALFISGDADSVLALSLLLWRWMNHV